MANGISHPTSDIIKILNISSTMKSIALSIALVLSLSFSTIDAAPANQGDSVITEQPARKKNQPKKSAKMDVSPELAILGAELSHAAQVQAKRCQQLRSHLQYNTNVKVFDLAGNLVAESVKGQQPQIPANADLLLTEGDTEYYVVIK
jgi:hypothetical protein